MGGKGPESTLESPYDFGRYSLVAFQGSQLVPQPRSGERMMSHKLCTCIRDDSSDGMNVSYAT